jgi:hypothetical protein
MLINQAKKMGSMYALTGSRKMENGIVVFWNEKDTAKSESFNYAELIEMKMNALDLLGDPKSYAIDLQSRTIVMKK